MIVICPNSFHCKQTNYVCKHGQHPHICSQRPHICNEIGFLADCETSYCSQHGLENCACEEIDHERYLRIIEEAKEYNPTTEEIWSKQVVKEAQKIMLFKRFIKPGGRKGR